MARLSDHRQPSLVRLRPFLRLAGRLLDVLDVLSLGAVHMAEPGTQRLAQVSGGSISAPRRAFRFRRYRRHAARALPGLPRHGDRSEPTSLRAPLHGVALLAERADVVLVATPGI